VIDSVIAGKTNSFVTEYCDQLFAEIRQLQRITLICGRGERIAIEDSQLPRASTAHSDK
jgi:hypothetical protein